MGLGGEDGLRTLHASMISSNLASFKFHKKFGFKEVGRYTKSRIGIDGKIYDEILMELTKEMYYENKNSLQ